jgi:hypothetical protein
VIKQSKLTIHISEHEDGARFYEWELRGVEQEEAARVFAMLVEDLRTGQFTVVKTERRPKLEDKEE